MDLLHFPIKSSNPYRDTIKNLWCFSFKYSNCCQGTLVISEYKMVKRVVLTARLQILRSVILGVLGLSSWFHNLHFKSYISSPEVWMLSYFLQVGRKAVTALSDISIFCYLAFLIANFYKLVHGRKISSVRDNSLLSECLPALISFWSVTQ